MIKRITEYMVSMSTTDKKFLNTLELCLRNLPEVLVLIRYSRSAGSKSFEFFSAFEDLERRLRDMPPSTNIIAFKQPQLPLRGVVDDAFIERCTTSIPDGSEFLVVETAARRVGNTSWFHELAGESHKELKDALEDMRGKSVAIGLYPPWRDESNEVISAIVPDEKGELKPGVY